MLDLNFPQRFFSLRNLVEFTPCCGVGDCRRFERAVSPRLQWLRGPRRILNAENSSVDPVGKRRSLSVQLVSTLLNASFFTSLITHHALPLSSPTATQVFPKLHQPFPTARFPCYFWLHKPLKITSVRCFETSIKLTQQHKVAFSFLLTFCGDCCDIWV